MCHVEREQSPEAFPDGCWHEADLGIEQADQFETVLKTNPQLIGFPLICHCVEEMLHGEEEIPLASLVLKVGASDPAAVLDQRNFVPPFCRFTLIKIRPLLIGAPKLLSQLR